jgi:RHS repeat-associated protein
LEYHLDFYLRCNEFFLLLFTSLILFSEEVIVSLGQLGSLRYLVENALLVQIDRLSLDGDVSYSHNYHYNREGILVSESLIGELGTIFYSENFVTEGPYTSESYTVNEINHLIIHTRDNVTQKYECDDSGKLIQPAVLGDYKYNQEGSLEYCGKFFYTYDEKERLVSVRTPTGNVYYEYDEQDRRVAKTFNGIKEKYVMWGLNEIAILDEEGCVKQLRIPGLSVHKDIIRPIAIETRNGIYCPFHDMHGNITKLINIKTRESISLKIADPYGRGLSDDALVPWIFSYKHYDPQTELVYFGHRFYSPVVGKWLTNDPAHQTDDPHEYCLYNPLMYFDPDGRFAIPLVSAYFGVGATVFTFPLWGSYGVAVGVGALIGYGGYKGYEYIKDIFSKEQGPPFTWKDLGWDSSICPGEGFVWKGKGAPGSGKGKWVKGSRGEGEQLYPDFDHPGPIGPHWDYWRPNFPNGVRINPDGTWGNEK